MVFLQTVVTIGMLMPIFRIKYDKPGPLQVPAAPAQSSTINTLRFKSTSSSLVRILIPVIHCNGWAHHHLHFPNLSHFARDILSIPDEFTAESLIVSLFLILFYVGLVVAVEWIFL